MNGSEHYIIGNEPLVIWCFTFNSPIQTQERLIQLSTYFSIAFKVDDFIQSTNMLKFLCKVKDAEPGLRFICDNYEQFTAMEITGCWMSIPSTLSIYSNVWDSEKHKFDKKEHKDIYTYLIADIHPILLKGNYK